MPPLGPDDDLAKLLPDAPPRPDRREAAIAEAMRRFDGGNPAPEARRRPYRIPRGWLQPGHPQWGVIMSAAVVAVIGVPLAVMVVREQGPVAPPAERSGMSETAAASNPASGAVPGASKAETGRAARQLEVPAPPVAAGQDKAAPGLLARAEPSPVMVAPPPPAPPPPPPPPAPASAQRAAAQGGAPAGEDNASVVVTGSRIARNDYAANSPVVAVDSRTLAKSSGVREAEQDEDAGLSIVVTGSRISASASRAARRGDWNACTINDPAHDLERCKREIGVGAKGDAGRAAARIADGISRSWEGDADGAIADFDAAIAIRPQLAFAYLNRGMAYARRGETERAVKDFDQAISKAPYDARAYYQRSVALRALGKDSRAISDAERAVSLDRRYEDLFD